MSPNAASFATDRSLRVPAGRTVVTGYVGVWKCQLANRERMAVGDVAGGQRCGRTQTDKAPARRLS